MTVALASDGSAALRLSYASQITLHDAPGAYTRPIMVEDAGSRTRTCESQITLSSPARTPIESGAGELRERG